eukprot:CAMPEP_0206223472 /NCGR_PEP_ID=MMETSP0047_2-20121206/6503_1 /ASSEMBLY_ACC=CAM_ASM_000192 /TAXON_ID=195065 /ORGANISM="Chroomonas mesostigmatica_cf, Strain CCMP1168" /LENGTH=147 /DNA_ID=CAMNT_0053646349 /DNA_START=330 /DNA_END=773 /DNA_ORIENTATION=+
MSTPTADPVKLMRLKSTSYAQPSRSSSSWKPSRAMLTLSATRSTAPRIAAPAHRRARPWATRVLYMQSAATSTSNDGRLLAGASMSRRLVESSMPCLSAAISSILRGSGFVSVDVTTAPARAATREHRPVPQPTSSTPLPSTSISPA